MASSSSQLIWRRDSGSDHRPEIWRSFQLAPHPLRDASVKKNRLGSGRCNGTPVITFCLWNQRRYVRKSASNWIGVSHDCWCWDHWALNQNWRNRRWRRPLYMNGAKCDSLLMMDEIFRAGMTVVGDRRDRTFVRVGKNESGGQIKARSRLKCKPRKSRIREGCNIDLSQLIVQPSDWRSWRIYCVCSRLCSREFARIIQSSKLAWTRMPWVRSSWTTEANVLVNSRGAVESPNGRTRNW